MLTRSIPWLMALGILVAVPAAAETTFINSTIERIDTEHNQVTIRTAEGKTWSLDVADKEAIKHVKEGDRASLELSVDGMVHKIVKSDEGASVPRGAQQKDE